MKQIISTLSLMAVASVALTASAGQVTSATACEHIGLTPVSSWLRNNGAAGNGTAYCPLNTDTSWVAIDKVQVATDTTAPAPCSLRNNAGAIVWPDVAAVGSYTWTVDQSVSQSWGVQCNVSPGKTISWTQIWKK
jgi:ABC-type amino acid transport substrate-binding protein